MIAFEIDHVSDINKNQLDFGIYLWIIHADKIPPHIGISYHGNYYSLKISGKDDLDSTAIFKVIELRKIPSLFVKVKEHSLSLEHFWEIKSKYSSIDDEADSCIYPILEMFHVVEEKYLLFELIHFLKKKGDIESIFGLNLPFGYKGIKQYVFDDVLNYLRSLEYAKRT